jgi:hypothetical protein
MQYIIYTVCYLKQKCFSLMFKKCSLQISAAVLVLIADVCGFPQSLQVDAGKVY